MFFTRYLHGFFPTFSVRPPLTTPIQYATRAPHLHSQCFFHLSTSTAFITNHLFNLGDMFIAHCVPSSLEQKLHRHGISVWFVHTPSKNSE